jgi:lipopolysaccharide transport system ATP-binding protein
MTENENGEVLVRVENVSKKFCRSLRKSLWYGLTDIASELIPRSPNSLERATSADWDESDANLKSKSLRPDEFWAVKDVSFELRRGECLGLIGHNGAGKTTLLKMLNGLIKPDSGRITIRGRVGALIALGAGFNPILTGRENVYVNGSVLGLSKAEIDEKIDEIIDFAEIREFIDTPVQNYSSGMQVRLGFAVATALKPDVLVLDEVLAVGDIGFQIKCGQRIRQLAKNAAIVFVTHNMQYLALFCTRAMLMSHGMVLESSPSLNEVVTSYHSIAQVSSNKTGTLDAAIISFQITDQVGNRLDMSTPLESGSYVRVHMTLDTRKCGYQAKVRVSLIDATTNPVMSFLLVNQNGSPLLVDSGFHGIEVDLGKLNLNAGNYAFLVAVLSSKDGTVYLRYEGIEKFTVQSCDMDTSAKVVQGAISRITQLTEVN